MNKYVKSYVNILKLSFWVGFGRGMETTHRDMPHAPFLHRAKSEFMTAACHVWLVASLPITLPAVLIFDYKSWVMEYAAKVIDRKL